MTVADLVSETELAEIIREAEAMTEALVKAEIEQAARRAYHSLVSAPEPPMTKQ
jgi:hypothetical protein